MENYALNTNEAHFVGTYKGKQNFLKVLVNMLVKVKSLASKNEELNSLIAAQKRIISILAHDLRNPLTAIKSIIEFKHAEILDSNEAGEMLDLVTGQLDNTIDMVDNVVNWGKLHLEAVHLMHEDFDLNQLTENVFGVELLSSKAKNNTLINHIHQGTIINSDKRVLEFILRNLVSNANKFTENGTIEVSKQPGVKTILSVTDTGVGMHAKEAAKLFDDNNNRSTRGTRNEKGSGLGLLLVKEFINRLNGSINVESATDKGTTVTVEF